MLTYKRKFQTVQNLDDYVEGWQKVEISFDWDRPSLSARITAPADTIREIEEADTYGASPAE